MQCFEPLFPPWDLNLLLNTENIVSIAQGQFYGIYACIISTNLLFLSSQSPQPLAKKPKKLNQPSSGLHSGWDSAIKLECIALADQWNTEDEDSLVQYGGMVGDDEDDDVKWSVVVKDKGSKQGPSNYVHTTLVHVSSNKLTNKLSHHP